MRVLVTGATGMIGSAVCDALLARGEEVAGLSRDPARARRTNPTVSWHAWDPANERPPEAAFEGVDAVVNLIGENINQRLTDEAKERIRASRGRATKNLVDGMLRRDRRRPRTLVSQAAIGYYGDRGEAIVDESTPPAEGFLPQIVVEWENEALKAERAGVRVVVFRTGLLLDPDGGLLKQLLLPFRLGVGGPLAGGEQYMPWIHRDDEVGLILWALDNQQVSGALERDRPQPGHQPRVLEGARPGAAPAGGGPGAAAGGRRDARRGARRADRRQLPGDPAAGARPRLPRSASPSSSRRCATCSASGRQAGRQAAPAGVGEEPVVTRPERVVGIAGEAEVRDASSAYGCGLVAHELDHLRRRLAGARPGPSRPRRCRGRRARRRAGWRRSSPIARGRTAAGSRST